MSQIKVDAFNCHKKLTEINKLGLILAGLHDNNTCYKTKYNTLYESIKISIDLRINQHVTQSHFVKYLVEIYLSLQATITLEIGYSHH